jgi:sugar lactone lactonase YvrE
VFDHLLVLDIVGGAVRRIDLDGTVSTVVADTGAAPDGIVHDPSTDRVYWTLMGQPTGRDFSARTGGLRSARTDGSDVTTVLADGAITTGKQLDLADGHLYWSDREGGRVTRAAVDGSDVTDLVVRPQDPATGLVDIHDQCVGIAVDTASGHLYWTQKGPAKGDAGRIFRAGIDIPDGETAETRTDIEAVWSDLPEPIDLWLDRASSTLFWTDRGAPPFGNTLNSAPVPAVGAPGVEPTVLAKDFAEAIGLAVDTEAGIAYVTALDGSVRAVPIRDGAPAERVVASVSGSAFTGIVGVER